MCMTREADVNHRAPDRESDDFRCPFCGAYAGQRWYPFVVGYQEKGSSEGAAWWGIGREAGGIALSFCESCRQAVVWHGQSPVWPVTSSAPSAARAMPAEVRADFEEARQVVDRSPRSAAALLRLALQKLSKHLGRPGENIPDDLEALMGWGLPDSTPRAVRVPGAAGDSRLRPGELDARDDRETARALFDLVNTVVDRMIAEPAAWRPA
jgi:hypothetical protein